MEDFEVTAYIGNEQKIVHVKRPFKTDDVYYVSIDRYINGQLVRYRTGWKAFLHKGSILTWEDGEYLCDILEKNDKERGFTHGNTGIFYDHYKK